MPDKDAKKTTDPELKHVSTSPEGGPGDQAFQPQPIDVDVQAGGVQPADVGTTGSCPSPGDPDHRPELPPCDQCSDIGNASG